MSTQLWLAEGLRDSCPIAQDPALQLGTGHPYEHWLALALDDQLRQLRFDVFAVARVLITKDDERGVRAPPTAQLLDQLFLEVLLAFENKEIRRDPFRQELWQEPF